MSDYILEMKNIRKEFLGGKIVANDDITLKIRSREIYTYENTERSLFTYIGRDLL